MAVLEAGDPEADLPKMAALLSPGPALVIDGLFGIGINRPLDEPWIKLIRRVNEAQRRVLSVDVPSGLNGDSGEPEGAAIEAFVTLTVGAPKQGLLAPAAWPFTGRLEVATDIGLVPCPLASEVRWTLPEDFAGFPPPRATGSHKGTLGHVAIIGGSVGYHGAAVLAARGAERARPGLISVFAHEAAYPAVAGQLQQVMVHPWSTAVELPPKCSAVLFGPGMASEDLPEQARQILRRLWADLPIPVVVDASALDWLPSDPPPENAIRLITPHPGEAARLLGTNPAKVQEDRPGTLRELSRRFGNCRVVLKGNQTLVGRDAGSQGEGAELFVNCSGNPGLAQGGAGDVLGGYLAGLLAQPDHQEDPLKTICFAVWQHGAAADLLEGARPNWIMDDLLQVLGAVRPGAAGQNGRWNPGLHFPAEL